MLHFQQNKLFMHSARSGDSTTRFKARIETVYLDLCFEFLTQVVNPSSEYSLLGSDSLPRSEQIYQFVERIDWFGNIFSN